MAESNIQINNIDLGPSSLKQVQETISSLFSQYAAVQTKNLTNQQLKPFLEQARKYQKQIANIRQWQESQSITEQLATKKLQTKTGKIFSRGEFVNFTKELMQIQYFMIEAYEFIQKLRQILTGHRLKYIIGISESDFSNLSLGEYTFEQLLEIGKNKMGAGEGLIGLGLSSTRDFTLKMGLSNTHKNIATLKKLNQRQSSLDSIKGVFSPKKKRWIKNKNEIIKTYYENAPKGGIAFESSIKKVASKTKYQFKYSNVSLVRGGDINEELTKNLTREINTELQVKLLRDSEEVHTASIASLRLLELTINGIVIISMTDLPNLQKYLKEYLFEANKNLNKTILINITKTLSKKVGKDLMSYLKI